jgi:hypothetical protein
LDFLRGGVQLTAISVVIFSDPYHPRKSAANFADHHSLALAFAETTATHSGILKLADVWQRRQTLNARSPPKERLPLWQVRHVCPRPDGKCSVAAGELTWRDCGAPGVSRWQSAQANL